MNLRPALPSAIVLASVLLPGAGLAGAPADLNFSIAAKPLSEALIDFALQADLSIGGIGACPGRSPGLSGRYTVQEGLSRLLSGTRCRFEMTSRRTVRILAEPPPVVAATRPPPAPPPALSPLLPPLPPLSEDVMPEDEVIVTATRRPALADRTPSPVSSVPGEELRETGASRSGDVVRQLASVTITNLGPGQDKILIRGLSDGAFTGRTQSTVGTYLDEVPINYNAPDPDLRLADVEGIEVVRGPQGALYGGGSLSGVYRIVTRKPRADRAFGRISLLGGATEGGAPSWDVEGLFNTPVGSGGGAVRAVAYREVTGGYLDDVNLRLSNVDGASRTGGRIAFRTPVAQDWTLTLGATAQQIRTADTQYLSVMGGGPLRANKVRESHWNDFTEVQATLDGATPWGQLTSTTAFMRHSRSSRYDASLALSIFDDNDSELGVYDEPVSIERVVEDVILTSPATGRLTWLAGAFGSVSLERTHPLLAASGPTSPPRILYSEDRTDVIQEIAGYGEVTYAVTPEFSLAAGLRTFITDIHTRSEVFTPSATDPRLLNAREAFDGVSPKLTASWRRGSALIYFLASEGYRAGGFNSGGLVLPGRSFRPDRLWNVETGIKASFWENKVKLRSALFYAIWSDIQTDQYLRSGLSYTTNVGDARNLGWEAELVVKPVTGLTLQASVLVNHPELTRIDPAFVSQTHLGLPGVPDFSFGALGLYERPLWGPYSLVLSVDATYVTGSRLTFDPALSPTTGGYALAKLSAQLKSPRWRLAAFLSNPANEAGDTFAYGNPFSFGAVRQVTPQRPRTLSLSLSVDF